MINDYETIIINAGGMGSAAAYHLVRDGRLILLLEQFEIRHPRGSSHGGSRIIRLSYDNPTYVQLARTFKIVPQPDQSESTTEGWT